MGKESELYQVIRDKDVQGLQKLLKKDQRVKASKSLLSWGLGHGFKFLSA